MSRDFQIIKLLFSGDFFSITLIDMFGFECYRRNKLDQLFVNCLNEHMQYFYNQRMFVWEMIEQEEEQIPTITDFHFYDNKLAVDQIMSKPYGLLNLMDDSTRSQHDHEHLTHTISTKKMQYVTRAGNNEIGIAHYCGKIICMHYSFSRVRIIEYVIDFQMMLVIGRRRTAISCPRKCLKHFDCPLIHWSSRCSPTLYRKREILRWPLRIPRNRNMQRENGQEHLWRRVIK